MDTFGLRSLMGNVGSMACKHAMLLVLIALLSACAGLPPRTAQHQSTAIIDGAQTPLATLVAAALPDDSRSGFRLQPYGPNAFATRLALARLATRSLDVQYYLLRGDNTGMVLMRALRDAAVRGVRVRVLLDDFHTTGEDGLLLALASHANVQVRVFNPFPRGRDANWSRLLASALDISRVNRRMHNKLFVADNVAAITGGRNIGDEYAMNRNGGNFLDMDVFVAGPVVRDLSDSFDHYWNSEMAYDVARIVRSPLSEVQLQVDFESRTAQAQFAPLESARGNLVVDFPSNESSALSPSAIAAMLDLPSELEQRRLSRLMWAPARVLYDPVEKAHGSSAKREFTRTTVTENVVSWMRTARHHMKMISPYFVPDESAIADILHARGQGMALTLVTNSLASTDMPWAYSAYSRYVGSLLRAGVKVSELSPTLVARRHPPRISREHTGASPIPISPVDDPQVKFRGEQLSFLKLHMKGIILDDRQIFLGSMNLDQRSAHLNTEVGLIIDSPEIAQQVDGFVEAARWYQLRLGGNENIEWVEMLDIDQQSVHHVPPETSAWERFYLLLVAPLIPEDNL